MLVDILAFVEFGSCSEAQKVVDGLRHSRQVLKGRPVECFFSKLNRISEDETRTGSDDDEGPLSKKPASLVELLRLDRKARADAYFVQGYGWDAELIEMDLETARRAPRRDSPSPPRRRSPSPPRRRSPSPPRRPSPRRDSDRSAYVPPPPVSPAPCRIVFLPHLSLETSERDLVESVRPFRGSTGKIFLFCQENIRHGFLEFEDIRSATDFVRDTQTRPFVIRGKRLIAEFSKRETLYPRDRGTRTNRGRRSNSKDEKIPRARARSPSYRSRSRSRYDRREHTQHQPSRRQIDQEPMFQRDQPRTQQMPPQAPLHPLLRLRAPFGAPSHQY